MTQVLAIHREPIYAPGREVEDARILELTAAALEDQGVAVKAASVEEARSGGDEAPVILAMCQGPDGLALLDRYVAEGRLVINSPAAIRNCYRERLVPLLLAADLAFPESHVIQVEGAISEIARGALAGHWWVKRGDVHATGPGDVVRATRASLQHQFSQFRSRGIQRVVLQRHVPGHEVKFYAVQGQGLVDWRWAGEEPGPDFAPAALQALVEAGARCLGVEVYGGDVIATDSGALWLVDVNDWPSFRTCQEAGAQAIATHVLARARQEGRL
ncbi:MAG: hypothetical protein HYV08_03495 [Deltaproteobacteria bacterium]|nr:hypothetical protein [Deltaproteobacteria bacterium]MBI3078595.1 hypothetical protein [Deltaproteobacteria bacterium]